MSTFGRGRGRGGKGNAKGRHESTYEVTSNLRLSIPQTPQLALEEPQVQTNVVLTQHPTAEEQHDSPRTHDSSAGFIAYLLFICLQTYYSIMFLVFQSFEAELWNHYSVVFV